MAEGGISPPAKRNKVETVFNKFRDIFSCKDKLDNLKNSYTSLCNSINNPLVVSEITSCNAAAGYGVTFSRAACETRTNLAEVYPFGSIFDDGLMILNKLVTDNSYIPKDRATKLMVSKLLSYLTDEKSHDVLRKLQGSRSVENETQLSVTLAEHFFSKLSLSGDYTMDRYIKNKGTIVCKCGECDAERFISCFGDTSIGSTKGWHGTLDIVLGSQDLFVDVIATEGESRTGRQTSDEVKMKSIEDMITSSRSQILAQTIVFSFLQQQRHPEHEHFLIPCIAATRRGIKNFFYDSENDIMIESRGIKFLMNLTGSPEINYQAIIAAWLVLNHKFLCSGPSERLLQAPKANFFKLARDSLNLYKTKLQFKDVDTDDNPCLDFDMIGLANPKPMFVWPSDVTKPVD